MSTYDDPRGNVKIVCDKCHKVYDIVSLKGFTLWRAKQDGWLINNKVTLCPACKK